MAVDSGDSIERLSFGQLLRAAREKRGFTVTEVAHRVGANKSAVLAWEEGREVPSGKRWALLRSVFPALRAVARDLPTRDMEIGEQDAQRPWCPDCREPVVGGICACVAAAPPGPPQDVVATILEAELAPAPVLPPIPGGARAATPEEFGAALRAAREREGVSQAQLAKLLGCGPGQMSAWETGRWAPVAEYEDKLRQLFDLPRLPDRPNAHAKRALGPMVKSATPSSQAAPPTAPPPAEEPTSDDLDVAALRLASAMRRREQARLAVMDAAAAVEKAKEGLKRAEADVQAARAALDTLGDENALGIEGKP